jgi:hypothetical protein
LLSDWALLGCKICQFCRCISTFQRNVLHKSSGLHVL